MNIIETLANNKLLKYTDVFDYHNFMYENSKERNDYMKAVKHRKVLVTISFDDYSKSIVVGTIDPLTALLHMTDMTWHILLVLDKKSKSKELSVNMVYLSSSDQNGFRRFNSHATISGDIIKKRILDKSNCLALLKICYDYERYLL